LSGECDRLVVLWQQLNAARTWATAETPTPDGVAAMLSLLAADPAVARSAEANLAELAPGYLECWRSTLLAGLRRALDARLPADRHDQTARALVGLYRLRGDHQALRLWIEAAEGWCDDCRQRIDHAHACESLKDTHAALADWFELCRRPDADREPEVDPELDTALAHSELLASAWSDYADIEPPLPLALFPAWCSLRGYLRFEPPAADTDLAAQALRAVLALLPDPTSIDRRKHLRTIAPQLLPWVLGRMTR
jgi:hypothetical protein